MQLASENIVKNIMIYHYSVCHRVFSSFFCYLEGNDKLHKLVCFTSQFLICKLKYNETNLLMKSEVNGSFTKTLSLFAATLMVM